MPSPRTRWSELAGDRSGADYAARLAQRLAAQSANGEDVHGEATFCRSLVPAPARILDAGCGTGRVAGRLAELGYDCVGVDADASMLAVARQSALNVRWEHADLAELSSADLGRMPFDLVLAAGNVIALLRSGTLDTVVHNLAAHLVPGGWLVTGFGLDAAHLPPGCPVTPLADYEVACETAGLIGIRRYATWSGADFGDQAGYVVAVHRAAPRVV
jgi:SAM-dependent methyltransferase